MVGNLSHHRYQPLDLFLVIHIGKSSLVVQFVENQFVSAYYPTIESTFTKSIKHNGVEYECDIIDTAGQDEFSILNSRHAVGIHGYVLVYSVANRASFELISIVHDRIVGYSGTGSVPCVVVGQKCDLADMRCESDASLLIPLYTNAQALSKGKFLRRMARDSLRASGLGGLKPALGKTLTSVSTFSRTTSLDFLLSWSFAGQY